MQHKHEDETGENWLICKLGVRSCLDVDKEDQEECKDSFVNEQFEVFPIANSSE
jgi:hypothetical protein